MPLRRFDSRLRILHVIPSVSPRRGGPSETIRSLVSGLAEQGLDVDVATTDDDGPGRLPGLPRDLADSHQYHCFPRQSHFYTMSWPLRTWLDRHAGDYHAIHIHSLFNWPVVVAAAAARRAGVPYIIRPLGTLSPWCLGNRRSSLKTLSLALMERPILRNAAWIHFSSEQERLEAEPIAGGMPFRVIPNPVAAGRQTSGARRLENQFNVLFLSRLDPVKGIDLLLPAFAQARAAVPELRLVLAGGGEPDYTAQLRQRAEALGLSGAIEWTGFVTGEQKEAALSRAGLFVLPSRSENFGVAAVEAMARGIPVLISDQVGIRREVEQAQAGLVVPCSAEAFARGILRLVREPALSSRVAANGTKLAETRYSRRAVAQTLIGEYESLAGARVPSALVQAVAV